MEGPRGHRGTYREPAIVNLVAGDDSGCSLDPLLPIEGSGRWAWRVLGSGCGREFVQRLPVRIRFNPDQDPQCRTPGQCAMTGIGPGSVSLSRSTNRNFQITKGEI